MYLNMMRSYVQWFQSRGQSFSAARSNAILALTCAAFFNITSALIVLGVFRVTRWAYAVAEHVWGVPVAVAGLWIIHWKLAQKVQPAASINGSRSTSRPWGWYMGGTIALWIIVMGSAIAIS